MRNLSLARLKKYVNAYNIRSDGVLEKDDLIERIIGVRVRASSNIASIVAIFCGYRRMDVYRTPMRYCNCRSPSVALRLLNFGS